MRNASAKADGGGGRPGRGKKPGLEARSRLLFALRRFFAAAGFIEVETPVRVSAPAPEEHIEALAAAGAFLRTSPELEMKRLLVDGYDKIFQIGACFRNGESGRLHAEEFTMLEWYESGSGYLDLLDFTKRMLVGACREVRGCPVTEFAGRRIDFEGEWMVVTMREVFAEFADGTPEESIVAGRFEIDLVEKIEPALADFEVPVVLIDYPASEASLSRLKSGDLSLAERWELYLGGIEIANAYGELTDAGEQGRRFAASAEFRRRAGMTEYPLATEFLAALERGMPECSGCALGIDRLAMCLAGADDIAAVRFPQGF